MLALEFIFRALPHIFRAKSIQPPPKNGPYAYGDQHTDTDTHHTDHAITSVAIDRI